MVIAVLIIVLIMFKATTSCMNTRSRIYWHKRQKNKDQINWISSETDLQITSVPKISISRAVVYYYFAWYHGILIFRTDISILYMRHFKPLSIWSRKFWVLKKLLEIQAALQHKPKDFSPIFSLLYKKQRPIYCNL